MKPSPSRLLPAVLIAVSLVAGPYAYSRARDRDWRNFRVVEEGVLYRSAQLSPHGLERVIHEYGIRTVVSFRDADEDRPEPPDQWEEALCARLGVNYLRLPLRIWSRDESGVVPAQANVDRFLSLMADSRNHPVLVHCFRGVHRTGTYCAIYRMDCQGWSNADALQELRDRGYDTLDRDHDVRHYLEGYAPGHTVRPPAPDGR